MSISKKVIEKSFEPKDECSICGSTYDADAGGVQGHFGITPVTFCEWCYASVYDMVYKEVEADFKMNNEKEPCGMSHK